jgi:uncharacterized membrane protein YfcA
MMLVVAALLSVLIGVVLGMLGGGGAILTLPMLVYALGVDPKVAIATSLFVVATTSLVGASVHARAHTVKWRVALVFGGAAMAGAFAGGYIAAFVPSTALLLLFSAVMLVTALAMLRGSSRAPAAARTLAPGRAIALGVSVGLLSGLVGAGGGFLIVPALTIFGGLTMREAIGTSLLVIALQSYAGFAGHVSHVQLDWRLIGIVTGAAVVGSVIGSLVGRKVPADLLRRGFAWLVVAMGVFIISRLVPLFVTAIVAAVTVGALIFVARGAHRDDTDERDDILSR